MDISDSNAERRNLTLLSLSIIIFYLADGQFVDGDVKLQVINVELTNTHVLVSFVWIMLFWFAFRYWLLNRSRWKEKYKNEIITLSDRFTRSFIKKTFIKNNKYRELPEGGSENFVFAEHGKKIKLSYLYRFPGGERDDVYQDIDDWQKKAFLYFVSFTMIFRRPTLTTYFMPYVLFILACALGCIDFVKINFLSAS